LRKRRLRDLKNEARTPRDPSSPIQCAHPLRHHRARDRRRQHVATYFSRRNRRRRAPGGVGDVPHAADDLSQRTDVRVTTVKREKHMDNEDVDPRRPARVKFSARSTSRATTATSTSQRTSKRSFTVVPARPRRYAERRSAGSAECASKAPGRRTSRFRTRRRPARQRVSESGTTGPPPREGRGSITRRRRLFPDPTAAADPRKNAASRSRFDDDNIGLRQRGVRGLHREHPTIGTGKVLVPADAGCRSTCLKGVLRPLRRTGDEDARWKDVRRPLRSS